VSDAEVVAAEILPRVDRGEEVAFQMEGRLVLVLLPPVALDELGQVREWRRRKETLQELEALRARVRARNQDLTPEQAEALANQVSREIRASLNEKHRGREKRDRRAQPIRTGRESAS
jgi:hypothetical protein